MFLTASYKRDKIIDTLLIENEDITSDNEALEYMDSLYDIGATLDELYNVYVINGITYI